MIEVDEVFHLWKEIGVCDVKEVARQVWLQVIALQDAMQSGLAGRHPYGVRLCQQMTRRPSQGPSSTARQWMGLAVNRNQPQLGFFRIDGRSSQTREVAEVACCLTASKPALHGPYRALHKDTDGFDRKADGGQRNHCIATAHV